MNRLSQQAAPTGKKPWLCRLFQGKGYVLAPWGVLLILFLIWELTARFSEVPAYILPPMSQIIAGTVSKFPGELWPHFLLTLRVIVVGFLVATLLGMLLAAIFSQFHIITKAVTPVIIWLVITPLITLIPLMTLWLGYDPVLRTYVVIVQATPIVTLNTLNGFNHVDKDKLELAKAVGCNRVQRFVKVIFMNAMPQVFTGIKLGCINATIAALSADLVSGNAGMGFKITQFTKYNNIYMSYGSILVVGLIGLVLYKLVEAAERRVVRWRN